MSEIETLTRDQFISTLKFDDQGLIPCIVQDVNDGAILMLGYMNTDSIKMTWEKQKVPFGAVPARFFGQRGKHPAIFWNWSRCIQTVMRTRFWSKPKRMVQPVIPINAHVFPGN